MKKIGISIIIVLLVFGINSCKSDDSVQIDITTGLQAYYPFSGDANDISGNGLNGVIFGDATLTSDRNGSQNSAYEFDGIDDYISTFSTFDFESRSLSLWINPSNINGSGGSGNNTLTHVAITQDDIDLQHGILRVDIDNAQLKLWAAGISGTYTQSISKDNWYHLVLVKNDTMTKYYIDGKFVGSGTSDNLASTFNPNPDFIIGGGRSGSNQFFRGKIDDVRIYNLPLNEIQIEKLFND